MSRKKTKQKQIHTTFIMSHIIVLSDIQTKIFILHNQSTLNINKQMKKSKTNKTKTNKAKPTK